MEELYYLQLTASGVFYISPVIEKGMTVAFVGTKEECAKQLSIMKCEFGMV